MDIFFKKSSECYQLYLLTSDVIVHTTLIGRSLGNLINCIFKSVFERTYFVKIFTHVLEIVNVIKQTNTHYFQPHFSRQSSH